MADKRAKTLDELLSNEYGVDTHPDNAQDVVVVGVTSIRLCANDPNRLGLTFVNNGAASVWVNYFNRAVVGSGFYLAANGGFLSLNWRDDFTYVSADWYAISNAAANNVTVAAMVTK